MKKDNDINKISQWSKSSSSRIKNRKWLRYSSNIARRVLAAIDDQPKLNQAGLAKMMQVSPQHISQIVKGKENLTLQTIAELSENLGVELISFPEYKNSVPAMSKYDHLLYHSQTDYVTIMPKHILIKGMTAFHITSSVQKSNSPHPFNLFQPTQKHFVNMYDFQSKPFDGIDNRQFAFIEVKNNLVTVKPDTVSGMEKQPS